jgi:hypothetical protein
MGAGDPQVSNLDFEVFAITLLLCAPSDLQADWLNSTLTTADRNQKLTDQLTTLGFSGPAIILGMAITDENHLFPHRQLFASVAQTLRLSGILYDQPGAHPPQDRAKQLVKALQSIPANAQASHA